MKCVSGEPNHDPRGAIAVKIADALAAGIGDS